MKDQCSISAFSVMHYFSTCRECCCRGQQSNISPLAFWSNIVPGGVSQIPFFELVNSFYVAFSLLESFCPLFILVFYSLLLLPIKRNSACHTKKSCCINKPRVGILPLYTAHSNVCDSIRLNTLMAHNTTGTECWQPIRGWHSPGIPRVVQPLLRNKGGNIAT